MSAGNPVEGVAARIKLPPGVTFDAGLENADVHSFFNPQNCPILRCGEQLQHVCFLGLFLP